MLAGILSDVEKSHIFKVIKVNDKYQIKTKDADLYLGVKDKKVRNNSNITLCNKSDDCKRAEDKGHSERYHYSGCRYH